MLLYDNTSVKKNHHNFLRVMIFVIYYKVWKKVGIEYLCYLTFTFFKFSLKTLYLEIVSDIKHFPFFFCKTIFI